MTCCEFFIMSDTIRFITDIRALFNFKNKSQISLCNTHRRMRFSMKKLFYYQKSAKFRKKNTFLCCFNFIINSIALHSKEILSCNRPYSVLLFYIMIVHLLMTPCICFVSNSKPFRNFMLVRGMAEINLQRSNRFANGFDGLELKNFVQARRNQIELDLNVAENINRFWLSITPCYSNLSTWYTELKQARENQRPRNVRNIYVLPEHRFIDRKKMPIPTNDSWAPKIFTLNCSTLDGCSREVRNLNFGSRIDLLVTNLGKGMLRFFLLGHEGDTLMFRMSARLSPYADFYGYPQLPSSSKVNVCWKNKTHLQISWLPSISNGMKIKYCVAINHETSLNNRCTAKTRLTVNMVDSQWSRDNEGKYFERSDWMRKPRITNAIYQCTDNNRIEIKLDTKYNSTSALYVNVFAINDIDLSQSYQPVTTQISQLDVCTLLLPFSPAFNRKTYFIDKKSDLYMKLTYRRREASYYLYYQRCRYFKINGDIFSPNVLNLDEKNESKMSFKRARYSLITKNFNGSINLKVYYNSNLGTNVTGKIIRLIPLRHKFDDQRYLPKITRGIRITAYRQNVNCDSNKITEIVFSFRTRRGNQDRAESASTYCAYFVSVMHRYGHAISDYRSFKQLKREVRQKVNRCEYENIWSDNVYSPNYSRYLSEKRNVFCYDYKLPKRLTLTINPSIFNFVLVYQYSIEDTEKHYGALAAMQFLRLC